MGRNANGYTHEIHIFCTEYNVNIGSWNGERDLTSKILKKIDVFPVILLFQIKNTLYTQAKSNRLTRNIGTVKVLFFARIELHKLVQ